MAFIRYHINQSLWCDEIKPVIYRFIYVFFFLYLFHEIQSQTLIELIYDSLKTVHIFFLQLGHKITTQ